VRRHAGLPATVSSIVLAWCACAFALDPSLDISQYAHTAWKAGAGLTTGKINAIAQTPDGYLWLGTDFGLLRFDGVRAVPWRPPAGHQLPSNNVSSLLAARDGTLWIGTLKGPASWKDGRLKEYPELAGSYIVRILEDREGTIWISGADPLNGKVCWLRSGMADCQGENARLGSGAFGLYEDRQGNIWVGAVSGLWLWKPGPPKLYPLTGEMFGVEALGEDNESALLVGWKGGIRRFNDGKIESYPLRGVGQFTATCILRDRDGGLWIGTRTEGLVHVHQGRTDVFTPSDGLSGATVQNIFEDREGSLWVVTGSGLDRFRDFAVATFTAGQGLSRDLVSSVLADRDGSVWVATYGGLDRWRDGGIRPWGNREGKLNGLSPTSLFQDSRGQIWVSTNRDFGYLEHDRFVPISGFPGGIVDGIAEDGRGDLWVANQNEGLIHVSRNRVVEEIPWTRLGHKENAKALTADAVRGGLWLGFYDGGVEHFADGKIQASYTAADGLRKGSVNSFRIEQDGTLWAATEGGLCRLKDGRFFTLGSKNGLPCDGVHWTVEDDDRSLWLYMQCGLIRIARPDVEGWTVALDKDDKRSIAFTAFDGSDGTPTFAAALWRYTPAVTKSLDGRIWFKAFEGVGVIDPYHLPFNKLPPPVHIEQITANQKTYWQNWSGDASSSHQRLPPLVRDLTIDYTALSLVVPEKVHFRFKLEGQDQDWREVVNDREVQYSNLVPGKYRFRVTACNNSGVWNEAGAFLDLSVAPTYYQTNWFRALCVAAFLTLVWVLYRLRIQQVRRQERKLRDVIETMPTFAWTTLPDGSVDFVNRHWQEYTGLSTESTVGSGWQAAVHPQDLKRQAEKWRASVATGAPFENEVRYRGAADGQYRWFLARAVPLRDARGKIVKWYGVSTDIEDRKRAEQLQADLAHINRVTTMGELTASLAHEIKQPIGATIINAEICLRWLARDRPDLDELRNAASSIVKDGKRAGDVIDRIRALYKKAPPQRQLIDTNEIISEIVVLLRGEANRYAVSMLTDLAVHLPKVTADRVQLQQLFMNLMLNGIEAMKESGGVLMVKSQLGQDGGLLISISDTGVGLPAEMADQIFNAFFTTKSQGSGMGLAISRSIVESHGGRLWATANHGRGATFHFNLPIPTEAV